VRRFAYRLPHFYIYGLRRTVKINIDSRTLNIFNAIFPAFRGDIRQSRGFGAAGMNFQKSQRSNAPSLGIK
jgi:hypothetical protein